MNTMGEFLRVTAAGESHGPKVTVILDGFPSGYPVAPKAIQEDLDRRAPGPSPEKPHRSPRSEPDAITITSGTLEGMSTGAPIAMEVPNTNQRREEYGDLIDSYRAGHSDLSYDARFGIRDPYGGGRSSFRPYGIAVVAAGALAKLLTPAHYTAFVDQVGRVQADIDGVPTREEIERSPVRCPDLETSAKMEEEIEEARLADDSIGGSVRLIMRGVRAGLGSPVFGKLDSELSRRLATINAVTAVGIGAGTRAAEMRGSQYKGTILWKYNRGVITATNNAGGIQGGISTGMEVEARIAFHPPTTIPREEETINRWGEQTIIKRDPTRRHDSFVADRAVPTVEAIGALTIGDAWYAYQFARRDLLERPDTDVLY